MTTLLVYFKQYLLCYVRKKYFNKICGSLDLTPQIAVHQMIFPPMLWSSRIGILSSTCPMNKYLRLRPKRSVHQLVLVSRLLFINCSLYFLSLSGSRFCRKNKIKIAVISGRTNNFHLKALASFCDVKTVNFCKYTGPNLSPPACQQLFFPLRWTYKDFQC